MVSKQFASKLPFLRVWMAFAVILIHSWSEVGGGKITYHTGLFDIIQILFSQGFCRIAVPVFFFVSGYLFFNGLEEWNWETYGRKVKSRITSLLIPYVLWNAIYWILYCVKQICVDHNVEVWCEYSIAEIFWANSGGWPMVVPLWFVRDLMVVIALAFVIYWLIKKTGIISIICLSILHIMNIWIPIPGFSSESALFFSAGCYVQINGIEPLSINKKVFTVAGVTYFTMVLLTVLNWNITPINGYLHSILAISGTVFVLKLSTYIETEKTNFYNTFAGATFFIFAVHEIYVLRICDSVLAFFFSNGSELDKICIYFWGAVLTFFICAGLFFILRKFTPRLCGVLVGKRI